MSALVLLLLVSGSLLAFGAVKRSAESEAGASVNVKAAEHWFPLFFMMNNTQAVQSPATWMLGAIFLGVTMFLRRGLFNGNLV